MSLQCRVCLEYSENCTLLFAESCGITLAEIIQFCADVKIADDDDLPSQVCLTCSKDAEVAYTFVQKCQQSDRELQTQKTSRNPIQTTTTQGKTHELLVELISESPRIDNQLFSDETVEQNVSTTRSDDSFTKDEPPTDDIYVIEYLDEDEIRNSSQEFEDQNIVENADLTTLNDQSESNSSYYCCYSDCTMTFHTKHELKDHINLQHVLDIGEQDIANTHHYCNNCGHTFSSENELISHELLLQLKKSLITPVSRGRPKTYPCLFNAEEKKCCDCYASFPTIESLLQHTMQRHSIRKTVLDPTRSVRCEVCFKLFRSKSSLHSHQNAPYKPRNYRCTTCGDSFLTPSRLAVHKAVHSAERNFKCVECGASFKNEQNLNTHALLHREKKEMCSTCGLRFHRKSNLRMHQRVHSDAYYTVCPHCDKKYKNQSQLKEHLKVHTKEKTLGCRYCAKRFMYTSDRKRHEMIHTGKYPFTCDCSKKFSRNRLYMRHIEKCKGSREAMRSIL
ncbi:zinc finger protein 586-like [Anopheles moucheti]|uniref:zinc finger protein 586-like n=1 Tax=Anopheles moucheti TaxID=186751 RepID=UPI0022EFEE05|nr:zinc finger protein 586-like [Anopheles moucheti]